MRQISLPLCLMMISLFLWGCLFWNPPRPALVPKEGKTVASQPAAQPFRSHSQSPFPWRGRITLFSEAETIRHGSASVMEDKTASNDLYISQKRAWNPLLEIKTSSLKKPIRKAMYLWIRYRRGSIGVTRMISASRRELGWLFARPERWSWQRFGPIAPDQLAPGIRLIRDGKAKQEGAHVDCIVLTDDPEARPIVMITCTSQVKGHTSSTTFGTNAFAGVKLKVASNTRYQRQLRYLNPGILRLHNWEVLRQGLWLKEDGESWNIPAIVQTLRSLPVPGQRILINIPAWPKNMAKKYLPPEKLDRFANWCANLVRALNIEHHLGIRYWEVTNEMDMRYGEELARHKKAERMEELARIFRHCAKAMKTVDPTIRVGAPAAAQPWRIERMKRFIELTRNDLDFLSIHTYASGSAKDPNTKVLAAPDSFAWLCGELKNMLTHLIPDKNVELHLNEYNISWTWQTRDPRMRKMEGAVFDSLVMSQCPPAADVLCSWNECDEIKKKMDNQYTLRPGAHVQAWYSQFAIGDILTSESSDHEKVVSFLVRNNKGERVLFLTNRSEETQTIQITGTLSLRTCSRVQTLSKGKILSLNTKHEDPNLELPPLSITLLIWNPSSRR
ncbi:MAG: hypothetical protein D6820_18745 [Lentisphaerae bacterium]|nr:MAG: hypothetical protein D6820_18745 [Lentisphaerota bacterium]